MKELRFEWDKKKEKINIKKHFLLITNNIELNHFYSNLSGAIL